MKSKLDQIERYLQKIVENSAGVLWKDGRMDLVRKLMEAIEQDTAADPNSIIRVPGTFVVLIHPRNFSVWQQNNEMLDGISLALQEAAVELDLPMKTRPSIFLEADPDVPENSLQLHIIHQDVKGSRTAILSADNHDTDSSATAAAINSFLILESGEHFPIDRSVINIGRRENNELTIDDPHVSREHAQIRSLKGVHVLFDLNSRGGTFVNGRKIAQHNLQPGDVISLSGNPLIYVVENLGDPPKPTSAEITSTIRMSPASGDDEEDDQ